MKVLIREVDIKNFKSIKEMNFTLKKSNLLIGKNNSGKSNILKALDYAFSYKSLEKDEVFVSQEIGFNSNREIIIDILIEPINDDGDFEVEWSSYFGEAVKQYIISDNDYFAFRTIFKYDEAKDLFVNRKYLINSWESKTISRLNLNRGVLENLKSYIIDAKRDIFEDINNKHSLWSKSTNNFNVDDATKRSIETSLDDLNREIIDGIDELSTIKDNLADTSTMPEVNIKIYPLTKDLNSLYKGMNIYYKVPNGNDVSVENNGMGVRSLAVLSSFKSYIEIEKAKYDSVNEVVYNLLLIEEPETHVHPQAQKHIYDKISGMSSQVITTTHSPYIVYKADLKDIMIASLEGAETVIRNIDLSSLSDEEIISISKHVIRTKGEVLFSNLVILCEGITEELLLPRFINSIVGKSLDFLGINIISVGGQNYKPFIQVLNSLKIPWVVLSDGETQVVSSLKSTIMDALDIDDEEYGDLDNIVVFPENHDIEYYLYNDYKSEISAAISEFIGEDKYNNLKNLLNGGSRKEKHLSKFNNVGIRDFDNEPEFTEVLDILYTSKANYGDQIALKILSLDDERSSPNKLIELCNKVKEILNIGDE